MRLRRPAAVAATTLLCVTFPALMKKWTSGGGGCGIVDPTTSATRPGSTRSATDPNDPVYVC